MAVGIIYKHLPFQDPPKFTQIGIFLVSKYAIWQPWFGNVAERRWSSSASRNVRASGGTLLSEAEDRKKKFASLQIFRRTGEFLGPILKISSPKNLAKVFTFFAQTAATFLQKFAHNIGVLEKRRFFRRKLVSDFCCIKNRYRARRNLRFR
jgi:hypothetical protein